VIIYFIKQVDNFAVFKQAISHPPSGGPAVRAARGRSHFFRSYGIVYYRPTPYRRVFCFFCFAFARQGWKVFTRFNYFHAIVEYTLLCWFH